MARVANALIDTQIRNEETGLLDLTETLKNLIHFYYLGRLADQDLKETMEDNLNELLKGESGRIEFEGKMRTRKEIFDILVERASMTEEERKKEIETRQKILEQVKQNVENEITSALQDPNIPEEIKNKLNTIKQQLIKDKEDQIRKNA